MRKERGQILIVTAAAIVVLFGISALVIDLGMSWMLRRQEQNAADPAALASARWLVDPVTGKPAWDQGKAESDACRYAQMNGFFIDDAGCNAALHTTKVLQVHAPPISGPRSGTPGYVQVIITSDHPAFFGRIFGQDTATVTTGAVAANTSGNSNSNSLVALDPSNTCEGGKIQGNPGGSGTGDKVQIIDPATGGLPTDGGYVYINSSCGGPISPPNTMPCGSGTGALKIAGSSGLVAARVYTVGTCSLDGGATLTTADGSQTQAGVVPIGDPLAGLIAPTVDTTKPGRPCGVGGSVTDAFTNNTGCGNGSTKWKGVACVDDPSVTCVSLSPGVYYGGWRIPSDKYRLQLSTAAYIIAGGGITQTGGTIEGVKGTGGTPDAEIMIYSSDNPAFHDACIAHTATSPGDQCQGSLNFTAGGSLNAAGLGVNACAADPLACSYPGMLLWQDGTGSCATLSCPVSVGGGDTNLQLSGTIYAPDQLVTIEGSSSTSGVDTASIQIISWRWKITGNSKLIMPYDPKDLYHLEQRGLVN